MDARSQVKAALSHHWTTLSDLSLISQAPLVDVSESLYSLRESGVAESSPEGTWKLCHSYYDNYSCNSEKIIVLVDLGNVHDCLQKIVPMAEAGELFIRAYADLQYNGFGVNPPLHALNCVVFRASSPQKNAADTQLVWDVAQLCCEARGSSLNFIAVTKDNGFRHLKDMAEKSGHSLSFAQDWVSLRSLILQVSSSSKTPLSFDSSARG